MKKVRALRLPLVIVLVLCLGLALGLCLMSCATLGLSGPAGKPLTTDQSLSLTREGVESVAYDIEIAHQAKALTDDNYAKARAAYVQAAAIFNAILAGTRPAADVSQVSTWLSMARALLPAIYQGGTAK